MNLEMLSLFFRGILTTFLIIYCAFRGVDGVLVHSLDSRTASGNVVPIPR